MEKFYNRINWQNKPNLATPLGATNLNKMDSALEELDNRTLELNRKNNTYDRVLNDLQAESNEHTQNIVNLQTQTESITQNIDSFKIVSTASGSPVHMEDSSNMNFEGIDFFGESTQNSEPTPINPVEIESKVVNRLIVSAKNWLDCSGLTERTVSGVKFTPVSENGILQYIIVEGMPTENVYYTINNTFSADEDSKYILNGCPAGGASNTYCLAYYEWNDSWSQKVRNIDGGNGIVLNHSSESSICQVRILIANGTSCNNLVFKPMIRLASITDSTYEPYQSQIVNLSAPIELNGIGDVKDYIDTERGVLVQKFGSFTFTGIDGEGWIASDTVNSAKKRLQTTVLINRIKKASNNSDVRNLMCNQFVATSPNDSFNNIEGITVNTAGGIYVYSDDFNTSDVSLWKAHLQANPMTVVYELATPIETSLPQADIDAIKALHSYKPNTVVMNDADAEMDVKYVSDVKIYIDRKFEALASAIVNQ